MNKQYVRLITSRGSVVGALARKRMVVEILDRLLAKKKNQRALKAAFERAMEENPRWFLRKIVMPLAETQDAPPAVPHDGIVEWKSLEDQTPPSRTNVSPINKEVKS